MFQQIVIVGGGDSIRIGEKSGLHKKISKCLTIGCNYAYKYYNTTINSFVDKKVYDKEESLKERLCTGHYANTGELEQYPEVYWLKHSPLYVNPAIGRSIYNPMLVGIWAISLAIYLMKGQGNIFLLGYDWTKKGEGNTHFYQGEIEHSGINKTNFYDENNPDKWFKPFLDEKGVNIYNVNPTSNINTFPKIEYASLFGKVIDESYSQDYLRQYIRAKLDLIRIK